MTPAEYPVLGEEGQQYRHQHIGASQLGEGHEKTEKLVQRHVTGLGQRLLHNVIEAAEPIINGHINLHLIPSTEQNDCSSRPRPE